MLLLQLTVLLRLFSLFHGFVFQQTQVATRVPSLTQKRFAPSWRTPRSDASFDSAFRRLTVRFATTPPTKDVNGIKHDIEELRQEALRRLDALNHKLEEELSSHSADSLTTTSSFSNSNSSEKQHGRSPTPVIKAKSQPSPIDHVPMPSAEDVSNDQMPSNKEENKKTQEVVAEKDSNEKDRQPAAVVASTATAVSDKSIRRSQQLQQASTLDDLNLLDGTHWKVMLNIGREPGTWMPKTWGASGERLLLNLELEFTPNQSYEREEFLNGMAGAKELRILEFSTAPSMTEGSRPVAVQPVGGWRIARGEGPAGTDLLRFYVQVEEEVRHHDAASDVYCPAGRVYFTCGYFPLTHRDPKAPSLRDILREEHDAVVAKYEQIQQELDEDTSGGGGGGSFLLNSWDRLKRTKELMDLRVVAGKLARQMDEARIREPEKASLRLSQKRDVGLTLEGGLCRKVIKGVTMEYHILGKFGVACSEHHYQQHLQHHHPASTRDQHRQDQRELRP